MSCQVIVKTSQHMQGSYTLVCDSPETRDAVTRRPDVWWFCFPEDDDMTWRRGGAWAGAEHIADAAGITSPVQDEDDLDWGGEDDEDGRW